MMFDGMIILDSNSAHNVDSNFKYRRDVTVKGRCVTGTKVHVPCSTTFRWMGYMRAEMNCDMTGSHLKDLHKQSGTRVSIPFTGQIVEDKTDKLPSNRCQHEEFSQGDRRELACQSISSLLQDGNIQTESSYEQSSLIAVDYSTCMQSGDTFTSSFSFIQQSLNMNNVLDTNINEPPLPVPLNRKSEYSFQGQYAFKTSEQTASDSDQPRTKSDIEQQYVFTNTNTEPSLQDVMPVHASGSDKQSVRQLPFSVAVSGESDKLQEGLLNGELLRVGQNVHWHSADRHACLSVTSDFRDNMPGLDLGSMDTEVTCFSVDSSDSTSASSMTSGYGSTTSFLDQNWNDLLKKYEEGLQNCLQENDIKSKIELLMLKLQMLQQKAALDDDYKTAGHFSVPLEELKEDGFLKLGLPFQHPKIAFFLERLMMIIHNALQRTNSECRQNKESTDHHILLKSAQETQPSREQLIQEKEQIQRQMTELQHRFGELQKRRLALEKQLNQDDLRLEKDVEEKVLQGCSSDQLQLIGRVLEDLISSDNHAHIPLSPLQSIIRVQEQKQDFGSSIKEAAANVVRSQRSDHLWAKVNENETELHEAKLGAISEQNPLKYTGFLHRCKNTSLEGVWEADLETCHLLLQGLELRALRREDLLPTTEPCQKVLPFTEAKVDCAMHTALEEFWNSEVNLQQSEFPKVNYLHLSHSVKTGYSS
ncbi:disrupted in schizophrenia 1 protein isoform X2 [Brachyhypopomus gauderio]|uniref:disrupted in schizophrenia 1 protein isoform X2 n=1 Tax=Brachyhypopomus gauderio TaxID=698409 RepID=UPI0040427534